MRSTDGGVQPVPYYRLIVKYALIALYGLAASIVGVTTVNVVGGSLWESVWSFLLTVLSLAAMIGIIRSKLTGKVSVEVVSTLFLIGLLVSYAVAIILRTLVDWEFERLPALLLPVIISVTPFARVLDISRKKKN